MLSLARGGAPASCWLAVGPPFLCLGFSICVDGWTDEERPLPHPNPMLCVQAGEAMSWDPFRSGLCLEGGRQVTVRPEPGSGLFPAQGQPRWAASGRCCPSPGPISSPGN